MRARGSSTAVLVLDLITDLAFPGGAVLHDPALSAARRIRSLLGRARARGVPVIYVNDNRGRWISDRAALLDRCSGPRSKGRDILELIRPEPSDEFVFKPKHSAFFGTPLDSLLQRHATRRLILTGISAHQCVLFTATDAHVREYDMRIPRDCVASPSPRHHAFAVRYFEDVLGVDTRMSRSIRLS